MAIWPVVEKELYLDIGLSQITDKVLFGLFKILLFVNNKKKINKIKNLCEKWLTNVR